MEPLGKPRWISMQEYIASSILSVVCGQCLTLDRHSHSLKECLGLLQVFFQSILIFTPLRLGTSSLSEFQCVSSAIFEQKGLSPPLWENKYIWKYLQSLNSLQMALSLFFSSWAPISSNQDSLSVTFNLSFCVLNPNCLKLFLWSCGIEYSLTSSIVHSWVFW